MNQIVLVLVLVLGNQEDESDEVENDEDDEGAVHGKPPFVFPHALGPRTQSFSFSSSSSSSKPSWPVEDEFENEDEDEGTVHGELAWFDVQRWTLEVRCSSQAWLDFIAGCPPAGLPYIHPDPPRRLRDKSPKTSGRFAPLLVPANVRFPWRRFRRRGRSRRRFCVDGLPSARRRERAHILPPRI